MKNRRARITFPVFNGYEVRVISSRNVEASARRLHEDLSNAEAGFITKEDRPGVGWLVLGLEPCPGTIAHECSHVVRALFAFAGVGNDEEAFAYHLDFLVGRIHKFLKKGKV